jgi:hypothetical protein
MFGGLMMHELANAVHRERGMADAARNRSTTRSYRTDKGGPTAGAQHVIGRALTWAGRHPKGGAAPRSEPVGPW